MDISSRIAAARTCKTAPVLAHGAEPSTLGELLTQRVRDDEKAAWLTYYNEGEPAGSWTRGEFSVTVQQIAAFLAGEAGLKVGDRVATVMGNTPTTVMLYFACWLCGLTVVPINRGEDDERIGYILGHSGARLAVVQDDCTLRAAAIVGALAVAPILICTGDSARDGFTPLDSVIAYGSRTAPDTAVTAETPCLIVYTSGTTGPPKGVVLDHGNLLADALAISQWHRFTATDRAMCVLPIHHVNGAIVTLVTPLYSGGSVVLNNRFSTHAFWKVLAEERCTWVSVVPTILAFLSDANERPDEGRLTALRHLICGAGPLTVETAQRFYNLFKKRVVHGYGLSETTCYSCFLPIDLEDAAYRHWMFESGFPSIGCPVTANEMAIHTVDGMSLGPDERGEIVIRGRNVMQEYFMRPEATNDAFLHGWFRSGDEGFYRMGTDGLAYFFISGRLKELIIRGGVNYSPFDIDEILNAIPGVRAAMAVGFENDYYGEEVGAYVQRMDGAVLTEAEVIAACAKLLPFSKRPKVVLFGEEFPVTSTGKYQRNKLKPLFAEWKGVQFKP